MNQFPIGRPRFVTLEDALGWHDMAIARHGGSLGLRDRGLLESALAMPRQAFGGEYAHAYPFEMAAAYAFHIAKNHPFVDGNKRAALLCCGSFLRMNGWDLMSEGTAAADAILVLIAGSMDKASFSSWLAANCRVRPSMEVRDLFQALPRASLVRAAQRLGPEFSARTEEVQATCLEAEQAMPFLGEIADAYEQRSPEGQFVATEIYKIFVALYRAAEDMGYEW